jgi:hypothetical protein
MGLGNKWWTPEQEEILKDSIGCIEQEWWTFFGLWHTWRARPFYPEVFCILRSEGQVLRHITVNLRQLDALIRALIGKEKHNELVAYLSARYKTHPECFGTIYSPHEYCDDHESENAVHNNKIVKEK